LSRKEKRMRHSTPLGRLNRINFRKSSFLLFEYFNVLFRLKRSLEVFKFTFMIRWVKVIIVILVQFDNFLISFMVNIIWYYAYFCTIFRSLLFQSLGTVCYIWTTKIIFYFRNLTILSHLLYIY
jgi:hypothetical protein